MAEHIQPTEERRRHGDGVELVEQAIADQEGRPSQPYRSIDILAALWNRGAICVEFRDAGEDFRSDFRRAQLDPLKALDLLRPPGSGAIRPEASPEAWSPEWARNRVWRAIVACGGISSLSGGCAWDVLGWQIGLKRWASQQGRDIKVARGILLVTLDTLARHYGKLR